MYHPVCLSKSMEKRVPVPPMLAMELLIRELESKPTRDKPGILLDGFPRSVQQPDAFEQQITNVYSTIIMDCSEDNLLQRLTVRAKSSGREDDDPAKLRDRINKFSESDKPVWELLSARRTTYKY
ncbi:hypothetical protein QBC46DRAFT_378504 [Diplogelasinospora grovesii]|uniref:Adenylate kinase n=1 Tax=Diplogelasinospora grovesii TaxID=303347 RepID=A0AAN6NE83_9PEZI|nr:hypothetical protein QBC46DRAFT_378504 [Diplogelasinospora grovesii]